LIFNVYPELRETKDDFIVSRVNDILSTIRSNSHQLNFLHIIKATTETHMFIKNFTLVFKKLHNITNFYFVIKIGLRI